MCIYVLCVCVCVCVLSLFMCVCVCVCICLLDVLRAVPADVLRDALLPLRPVQLGASAGSTGVVTGTSAWAALPLTAAHRSLRQVSREARDLVDNCLIQRYSIVLPSCGGRQPKRMQQQESERKFPAGFAGALRPYAAFLSRLHGLMRLELGMLTSSKLMGLELCLGTLFAGGLLVQRRTVRQLRITFDWRYAQGVCPDLAHLAPLSPGLRSWSSRVRGSLIQPVRRELHL